MSEIRPLKRLGQHWLTDKSALQEIVEVASIDPEETVLEIGAGKGTLTEMLALKAKAVIALEIDPRLIKELKNKFANSNVEIVDENILHYDLSKLPKKFKVVANIPYYLTSNLIRYLSESSNPPISATLLVQKEIADRLTAKPGNLSILGVTAQFYWNIQPKQIINAYLFTPPPKVNSQVVIMSRKATSPLKKDKHSALFNLVKLGFSQKRKKLINVLGSKYNKNTLEDVFKELKLNMNIRAQDLAIEDWIKLLMRIS